MLKTSRNLCVALAVVLSVLLFPLSISHAAGHEVMVSDLAGTWRDGKGNKVTITEDGYVTQNNKSYIFSQDEVNISKGTELLNEDGSFVFPNSLGLVYVPAGQKFVSGRDNSRTDQDRFVISNQGVDGIFESSIDLIYYRSSVKSGESSGMDVQSIAEGDYSSAVGTYVNDAGKVITISQDGVESFRDDATGILFTGDDEVEGVYTEFYEHQGGVVYPMEKVAYLPKGEEMTLGHMSSSEMKMVTISEEVDSIVLSSSGGTPFTSREAVLSRVYRRQQTPTSEGLWDEQKAQKLEEFMQSWGEEMGQPGYTRGDGAYKDGSKLLLLWNGEELDAKYSRSGKSDAYYTIVARYTYLKPDKKSIHDYYFAILPDDSTSILYTDTISAPGVGITKLNTENVDLQNAFANIIND